MSEKTYSEVMNDFRQHIGANEIVATDPEDVYAIEAKIGKKFADELDAAHKREVGALRQRCTELNAEVAAKDEVIKRLNDAIAEEQRRKMTTAEKSSAAGDAAKLREALTKVEEWMARRIATCGFGESATFPTMLEDVVLPALAAPPRNCDRPECATTKAAQDVWRREDGGKTAYYEWLLATAKEGGKDGNE